MWNRKSVKQKGKKAFYSNFWKSVLVALILSIILGVAGSSSSSGSGFSYIPAITGRYNESDVDTGDPDYGVDDNDLINDEDEGFFINIDLDDPDTNFTLDNKDITGLLIGAFIFGLIISLIVLAFSLALKYFLLTPFEYGCRKFFRKNLDEPAKLSNIVYVFSSHYKNIVKTAFLTDLFIGLWSLLFIIPGIIKSYEYRLVPYIMSENPTMNFKDAQAESSKLMKGNKWKSFVLDLSFIGWDILSLCTFGILDIFFVGPYKASTDAALYETLKYGIEAK
jgi:uncharacterized membrane protein